MSKIDCMNIYNFLSEWERRRKFYESSDYTEKDNDVVGYTPVEECFESINSNGVEAVVENLQKWSDTHPKMTRKEKFKELLKGTEFEHEFYEGYDGNNRKAIVSDHDDTYWNEEVY